MLNPFGIFSVVLGAFDLLLQACGCKVRKANTAEKRWFLVWYFLILILGLALIIAVIWKNWLEP